MGRIGDRLSKNIKRGKLGTWELGESFFDAGVIFLWSLGKEGNQEYLLPFKPKFQRT